MKSIVIGIVVSFAVILTASWWLLGSTVPGLMVFIVGAAVWLWRYRDRDRVLIVRGYLRRR